MLTKGRFRVPSTSALIAFECTARHGSMNRAARELAISQSAISQKLAALERELAVRLFDRSRKGVSLTAAGRRFRDAVVPALRVIHAGGVQAAKSSNGDQVVIACSHDASHLLLMPRYDALKEGLGTGVRIRLLTYQRFIEDRVPAPMADILLSWRAADLGPRGQVIMLKEEVQPVCSPDYAATHAQTLQRPATDWGALTLLDLKEPNLGWASWQDWFDTAGHPEPAPRWEELDTYTQVLEAAVAGRGVALGWRHYIKWYLDTGALVPLAGGFVDFPGRYFAALTRKGQRNPLARACLTFFKQYD